MDYIVYILFSAVHKNLYIGQTKNLEKKLGEHNLGLVKFTKNMRPLTLLKREVFPSRYLAMKREKCLKNLYGYKERKS